jgi:hypothetical protein
LAARVNFVDRIDLLREDRMLAVECLDAKLHDAYQFPMSAFSPVPPG